MQNNQEKEMDTELRIFEAAKRVFAQKGMDGASMQDIATSAGISRTSLHYYYRSKRKLFNYVFDNLFEQFLPQLEDIMYCDCSFRDKIKRFVSMYLDMLMQNKYIPNFITNELNKNPDYVIHRFSEKWIMREKMQKQIQKDLVGYGSDMDASQFMVNLLSLCIFPFITRPLVEAVYLKNSSDDFCQFIEKRKSIIVDMLMASIDCISIDNGREETD